MASFGTSSASKLLQFQELVMANDLKKFQMNRKAFCLLGKSYFAERCSGVGKASGEFDGWYWTAPS